MTEHEKRIREALEAGPKLAQSSVMHFAESLHGKAGELDAWLECNDEKEVKAHVIAYAGALLADLDAMRGALKECHSTLTDERLGLWHYMEGSQIYSDFKQAADRAIAALKGADSTQAKGEANEH